MSPAFLSRALGLLGLLSVCGALALASPLVHGDEPTPAGGGDEPALSNLSTTTDSVGGQVPNEVYASEDVGKPLAWINAENGAPRSHGLATIFNGYLSVIYSEGADSHGGFSFYDISDPRAPQLVSRRDDDLTHEIREAHGYGFSNAYSGSYVALQAAEGIQFWDWTDVTNPVQLSYLRLPWIADSDYSTGAWWLFWQAPYVYVGGSSNGLYIVDASDPRNPVLVDRGAGRPNPIPRAEIGGFRIGPLFAVGNLLVVTAGGDWGYALLDISDPINPVLISASPASESVPYSSMFNGNRLLLVDRSKNLLIYDTTDPTQVRLMSTASIAGPGGYLTVQDGIAHVGASTHYAKVDFHDEVSPSLLMTATGGIPNRDEDFVSVIGNLVAVGDDHGHGTYLMPHQAQPDTTGPVVTMVNPADGAGNQQFSSRIGLTFSDAIDLRSVTSATLTIRPVGGQPLVGKYSYQTNIVNFFPDEPLAPGTTYEVVVSAGGIRDYAGNPVEATFVSHFTSALHAAGLGCEVDSSGPQIPGELVNFRVSTTGASTGTLSYTWTFGDGTAPTTPTVEANISHTFAQEGHYTPIVRVSDRSAETSCATAQLIHAPLTETAPTHSSTMVMDAQRKRVWVVNSDTDTVTSVDMSALDDRLEFQVGDMPQTLAVSADSTVWVINQGDASISVLDGGTGAVIDTLFLAPGSRPYGIAFAPDGHAAYVTLEATGQLVKLDPAGRSPLATLDVGPTPRGIAITADSQRILVTRFISPNDHAEVVEVEAATFNVSATIQLAADPGPDTEASGRGVPNYLSSLTIAPDGRSLWVPSKKDNISRGLVRDGTQLTFDSTVRTIVSRINLDTSKEVLADRLDLNDRDMAATVEFSPLGDYAFVATQGSNTIDVFDAYNNQLVASIERVGLAPRGMVISPDGSRLFVHNFMSRSLAVYDITGVIAGRSNPAALVLQFKTIRSETLPSAVLRGKQLFYNARDTRMNRDGYISCASCHLDGGEDGRVWDFTDRGEGLRNTISLLGRGGMAQGHVHWTANFDEIQDFEHDIRDAFGGSGFVPDDLFHVGTRDTPLGDPKTGLSPELDDLAAYVTSLKTVHPSPYRNPDGSLTADGQAGRSIFVELGCHGCHAGPGFTDSATGIMHDVGTIRPSSGTRLGQPLTGLDTPTLKGIWQTAPYLHDGSAATLMDVLTMRNPDGRHGDTASLTENERWQLIAYLLQIDESENNALPTPTPVPSATSTHTRTPVPTSTQTPVPSATSIRAPIPSATRTRTPPPSPTRTATHTPTGTPSPGKTPLPTTTRAASTRTATATRVPASTTTPPREDQPHRLLLPLMLSSKEDVQAHRASRSPHVSTR